MWFDFLYSNTRHVSKDSQTCESLRSIGYRSLETQAVLLKK